MMTGETNHDRSWRNYRRALGKEDREVLDDIIGRALSYAPAVGPSTIDRMEALILSMLLEQEKEIRRLKEKA